MLISGDSIKDIVTGKSYRSRIQEALQPESLKSAKEQVEQEETAKFDKEHYDWLKTVQN